MGRPGARRVPVVVALVLALATGCAGSQAPPVPHDPPLAFGAPTGTLLPSSTATLTRGADAPELPVAVDGTTLWSVDGGGLARADSTGATLPVPLPAGRRVDGAPRPVPAAGLVLAAAVVSVPGSGTTPPSLALELVAAPRSQASDPAPEAPWTAGAALPWTADARAVRVRVAGVVTGGPQRVAVLTAATTMQRTSLAVDLDTRRVLWTADGVEVGAVLDPAGGRGGVAVGASTRPGGGDGYTAGSVVGLDVATGARRFEAAQGATSLAVARAGAGTAAVGGRRAAGTARTFLTVLDADGGPVGDVDLGTATSPPRCRWDEAGVTVCASPNRVFAIDARSAALLWSLPADGRVAPDVTAVWHGAVYGTTVNGPVVVDARTGRDLAASPGAAPAVVGPYLGVARGEGMLAGAVVVPTTG